MPTYQITNPNTSESLKVTSNRQPTQEEALALLATPAWTPEEPPVV